jgi:hypothetical protein
MVLKIFLQNLAGAIKVTRFGKLVRTRQSLGSCLRMPHRDKAGEREEKNARPHPSRSIANFMDPV